MVHARYSCADKLAFPLHVDSIPYTLYQKRILFSFQIKNNPAAKAAFMAFTTAPAKAARAQAAANRLQEEENEVTHQQNNSFDSNSTVVEVHMEVEPPRKTPLNHWTRTKHAPSGGLTYTSLWPSAKDVVITTAPSTDPNHTSCGQ